MSSSFTHRYETYAPEGGYVSKTETVEGPFYHGGRARVKPDAEITPGRKTNSWGDQRGKAEHVYFSTEPATAASYARATRGHMYEVEPTGEAKFDGSGGDGSYKTQSPLRVIRKIPEAEWGTLPRGRSQRAGAGGRIMSDDNPCDVPELDRAGCWTFNPVDEVWWARTGRDTWTEIPGTLDDPPPTYEVTWDGLVIAECPSGWHATQIATRTDAKGKVITVRRSDGKPVY